MRSSAALCTAIALLTAHAPSAPAQEGPDIPSLSNAQVEQLNSGEVLIDTQPGDIPVADVMGVVEYPWQAVLDVIRDFDSYQEYMDDMSVSEILSMDEETGVHECHGITDTPWPMEDREWVMIATPTQWDLEGVHVVQIAFDYVPGSGNVNDIHGYWLLMSWGEDGSHTLLRYHLAIDIGSWLPDFVLAWASENFLPEKITDMRDRLRELAEG